MKATKTKPIIAVDLDDVLAANAASFVEFSNQQWGTKLTVDDFQEDFSAMWGIGTEDVTKRMHEFADLGIVANYPYFEDAIPVLRKLSKRFDLIIVTSRRKLLIEHTRVWLEQYFGDIFKEVKHAGIFDDLKQSSYHMTKAEICRDIKADYLIDDQLKHCFAVAEAGIETILFGDYSWNRADALPSRVHRASNWEEVGKFFDETRHKL